LPALTNEWRNSRPHCVKVHLKNGVQRIGNDSELGMMDQWVKPALFIIGSDNSKWLSTIWKRFARPCWITVFSSSVET
jgi:hypothetical protein